MPPDPAPPPDPAENPYAYSVSQRDPPLSFRSWIASSGLTSSAHAVNCYWASWGGSAGHTVHSTIHVGTPDPDLALLVPADEVNDWRRLGYTIFDPFATVDAPSVSVDAYTHSHDEPAVCWRCDRSERDGGPVQLDALGLCPHCRRAVDAGGHCSLASVPDPLP